MHKIRKSFAWIASLAAILIFSAGLIEAQSNSTASAPPPPPPQSVFYERVGPGPMMGPDVVTFQAFEEGLGGKIVTGAPFSATFTSESTQTLADGNVIRRNSSGSLARDSQGRTRRDMTLPAMGPWATSGGAPPHAIFINDPVAGAQFVLEPDHKIARKLPAPPDMDKTRKNRRGHGERFASRNQNNETSTSLGTQTINGVQAEGTRVTRTIAAGEMGNEKPIVITTERWYSPDLQTYVMTKRSDPRMGDSVYQLTNIQRSEPDAALFQVPSDYTVKKGRRMAIRFKGSPEGAPPLPPPPPPDAPQQ
ncbi:MAG: hypothetical protein ACRD41_01645 [Candidatus Acidiferrales bacterium]